MTDTYNIPHIADASPSFAVDPATGLATKTLNDVVTAMGNVGVSRYPSTSFYKAIRNFTGATAGDVITNVVVLDVTTNTTVSSVWRNKNTSADLATPPVIGTDVTYTTGDQLTDPQLRASPVPMSVGSITLTNTQTDASGTITLGGTAQTALAAQASGVGWTIHNPSDTIMYFNPTGTATTGAGSIALNPGDTIDFSCDANSKGFGAISILCATTGKAFTLKYRTVA